MNRISLAAALCALPFSVAHAAIDGTTATATGSAGTVVVRPIQVIHDTGAALGFGTIMGTTVNSSMKIGVDGSSAASTGAIVWAAGSRTSADAFTVIGEPNKAIAINVASSFPLTGTAPGAPTINAFPNPSQTTATLSGTGTYRFTVGGYYAVDLPPRSGTYTGTYQVNVAYN